MPLALAPGISFAEDDGERVFLDLHRDRYFKLGTAADEAFAALIQGQRSSLEEQHFGQLAGLGILVDLPFAECPRPCRRPALYSSAVDREGADRPTVLAILTASWSIKCAQFRLGHRSLAANVARLREHKAAEASDRRPARNGELERIAAAYAAAGRLISTLDQCLALSFAMAHRCIRVGLDATLAMGVKLRPFEAHAWVTVDGILVSDQLDNVRPFTPILII